MICQQCGNEQEDGKFCGKCGALLSVNQSETNHPTDDTVKTPEVARETKEFSEHATESMEKVKKTSQLYSNYFKSYIKQPSRIFARREEELTNGIISSIIVAIFIALTTFFLLKNISASLNAWYLDFDVSFFQIFFAVFLFTIVTQAIVVILLYLINHWFGETLSFKAIISIYGTMISPVMITSLIALIFSLLNLIKYGIFILLISFSLAVTFYPLYIISSLLTKKHRSIDSLYAYTIYLFSFWIISYIYIEIVFDLIIGDAIDTIMRFLI